VLGAVGGLVLALGGGAVLFLTRERKPKPRREKRPPKRVRPHRNNGAPGASRPTHHSDWPTLRFTPLGREDKQIVFEELSGRLVIGRDPAKANLIFDDHLLSSRHCSISHGPEGVTLYDLGSTNGTYVNGLPVTTGRVLSDGDVILLGSMELRVNIGPQNENKEVIP